MTSTTEPLTAEQIEGLRASLTAEGADGVDTIHHGSVAMFRRLFATLDAARAERVSGEATALDGVYAQRNMLVGALSKLFPAWLRPGGPGWPVVIIQLPTGQVSWHVTQTERYSLFAHLEEGGDAWDGHDDVEKWRRVCTLSAPPGASGEVERLRAALEEIANYGGDRQPDPSQRIARAALAPAMEETTKEVSAELLPVGFKVTTTDGKTWVWVNPEGHESFKTFHSQGAAIAASWDEYRRTHPAADPVSPSDGDEPEMSTGAGQARDDMERFAVSEIRLAKDSSFALALYREGLSRARAEAEKERDEAHHIADEANEDKRQANARAESAESSLAELRAFAGRAVEALESLPCECGRFNPEANVKCRRCRALAGVLTDPLARRLREGK